MTTFVPSSQTFSQESRGSKRVAEYPPDLPQNTTEEGDGENVPAGKRRGLGFNEAALVGDHYSSRKELGLIERARGQAYHLKNLNNWIKSMLIQEYVPQYSGVLDLCCGKGGDLLKWSVNRTAYLVMADIAKGSVFDALNRYNELFYKRKNTFPAKFFVTHCFEDRLDKFLDKNITFDAVSCQFAAHYAFDTEQHLRMMLSNAVDRLKPGGVFIGTVPDANVLIQKLRQAEGLEFGNSIFRIKFATPRGCYGPWDKTFPAREPFGHQYLFYLAASVGDKAVDGAITYVPEYIVHFPTFERIAKEYGLQLEMSMNFHDFFQQHHQKKDGIALLDRMRVVRDIEQRSTMSADEWEVAYLYRVFAFRKGPKSSGRQSTSQVPHNFGPRPPVPLKNEDVCIISMADEQTDFF